MIDMLKRHEIQVLRRAGHSLREVARLSGVARRSVVRVEAEAAVRHVDNDAERALRGIGRPAEARPAEGLPGEFSQHDFGEIDVNFSYLDAIVQQKPGLVWLVIYDPNAPGTNVQVGLLCARGEYSLTQFWNKPALPRARRPEDVRNGFVVWKSCGNSSQNE